MKLTKKQLIKLIKEAMYDPRTLPKDRIPTSMIASDDDEKDLLRQLSTGGKESYNQAAALAEPPAVIDMAGGYQGALKKADRIRIRGFLDELRSNNLKDLGFKYVQEQPGPDFDYSDFGPQFRFQARALGCEVEHLAFVDTEDPQAEKTLMKIYDIMRQIKATQLNIPGDVGDFGQNSLYDMNGMKVLLTGHYGGYYTATLCGK